VDLSLPRTCCDTAVGASCLALLFSGMCLKRLEVSSFFHDVGEAGYGMYEQLPQGMPRSLPALICEAQSFQLGCRPAAGCFTQQGARPCCLQHCKLALERQRGLCNQQPSVPYELPVAQLPVAALPSQKHEHLCC